MEYSDLDVVFNMRSFDGEHWPSIFSLHFLEGQLTSVVGIDARRRQTIFSLQAARLTEACRVRHDPLVLDRSCAMCTGLAPLFFFMAGTMP